MLRKSWLGADFSLCSSAPQTNSEPTTNILPSGSLLLNPWLTTNQTTLLVLREPVFTVPSALNSLVSDTSTRVRNCLHPGTVF